MSDSKATAAKRVRHKPVKGAPGVYKSQRASGWVYEVRLPGKQRLYEVVGPRLDQAKARAREVHALPIQVASVATRLDEAHEEWKRVRQVRPHSADAFDMQYRVHIKPVLGHRKVREIDGREIEAWLNTLRRRDGRSGDLGAASKRLALTTLWLILQHAIEMGAIGSLPHVNRRRVPKPPEGRTRILSQDEELRLLAYCGRVTWLRPVICVALHQALRMGEVLGLQWEDVDFANAQLYVRHALGRNGLLGPTKGGREEAITLTPKAREALLHLRLDASGSGPVFLNTAGAPRQLTHVDRAFRNVVRAAGLQDGVVFHSLRHTGISRLANHADIPLVQVRDFARHRDLATTQGYVHRIESERVTAAIAEALAR